MIMCVSLVVQQTIDVKTFTYVFILITLFTCFERLKNFPTFFESEKDAASIAYKY